LAYGAGRSYGDSCLAASGHVVCTRALDRIVAADWQTGVLQVEAGASLSEVLEVCVPRGWFLPVVPGTSHATVGGAVANDVHGKNHHRRGTFGCHVRRLGLLRSDAGAIVCDQEQHGELFAATIGGLGMTGLIQWVELQLLRIASSGLEVKTQRFGNLDEFFNLSDSLDEQHEFCVSWVDCASGGTGLGRGVYMAGDFLREGPLHIEQSSPWSMPLTPPCSLVNRWTLTAFNQVYWRRAPKRLTSTEQTYRTFFFPLDGISHWNRVYGPQGFQQYQALIPQEQARDGIGALLGAIAASGSGSFLAVLKRCGNAASPGLLSFPGAGVTLALDFAQSSTLESKLFARLDAIVREAGGRLYPAKDAHMSGEDFRRGYPQWEKVETLRDPALLSRFWQRVTK
jgi:FAD/FMN-containing dehydrogenase